MGLTANCLIWRMGNQRESTAKNRPISGRREALGRPAKGGCCFISWKRARLRGNRTAAIRITALSYSLARAAPLAWPIPKRSGHRYAVS